MQDISYKKSSKPAPQLIAKPTSLPKAQGLALYIEKALELSGKGGDFLAALTQKNTPGVVTSSISQISPTQPKRRGNIKSVLKRTTSHTAARTLEKGRQTKRIVTHTARRTKESLKTPIGKVALTQSLGLAALLIFVLYREPSIPNTEAKDTTTTSTQGSLRRFLPSVANYQEPKAFEETKAVVTNQNFPLHTWLTPWNLDDLKENQQTRHCAACYSHQYT